MKAKAVWCVAAVAAACLLTTAPAGAATIRAFGNFRFATLGVPKLQFQPNGPAGHQSARMTFNLPAGTREDATHWFVLHLHAVVDMAPDSPQGKAYLSAVSRGYGAVNVVFTVRGPRQPVEWQTLSLLSGVENHTSASRRIDVRIANYVPIKGIAGGENRIGFGVQQFGALVRSVTILPDSSIEYTPVGPGRLVARAAVNHTRVAVGQRVVATLAVENSGSRSVHHVGVSALKSGDTLAFAGPSRISVGTLVRGQKVFESFAFTAVRPGPARIFFLVASSANQYGTDINVRVIGSSPATSQQHERSSPTFAIVGSVLAAALLIGASVYARKRKNLGRRT